MNLGDKVTSIGNSAFSHTNSLESLTIPHSVTKLGEYVFAWSSVKEVRILGSVETIETFAFHDAAQLQKVELPDTLKTIKKSAFWGCSALSEINLPDSITTIEDNAFWECESLTEVYIPRYMTTISEGTFCGCSKLSKVVIPAGVTEIKGIIPFYRCPDLSIYGFSGSAAEAYANKNYIKFVPISAIIYGDSLFYGNVDGDDSVSSSDALLILRESVGLEAFSSEQRKYADVNLDNSVDSADSLAVLRYSVGYTDNGVKIGK